MAKIVAKSVSTKKAIKKILISLCSFLINTKNYFFSKFFSKILKSIFLFFLLTPNSKFGGKKGQNVEF